MDKPPEKMNLRFDRSSDHPDNWPKEDLPWYPWFVFVAVVLCVLGGMFALGWMCGVKYGG